MEHAPHIGPQSALKVLDARLKGLGLPFKCYGTKGARYASLCEAERELAVKKAASVPLESRRAQMASATDPVVPVHVPSPTEPTAIERALHDLTHTPPARWCAHCIMGFGKVNSHKPVTLESADKKWR